MADDKAGSKNEPVKIGATAVSRGPSPADKAIEKAFVAGTLPEKDRRAESAEVSLKAGESRAAEARAAEEAAPTGADFPERAAPNIPGHQTAGDSPISDKHKNSAAQTEPAILARDGGSVPHGMIATPTGLVPASAAGGAEGLARFHSALKESEKEGLITEEKLLSMNKHDIRAAAHDRGYRIGEGSVRSLTRRFLEEQAKVAASTPEK